MEGIKQVVFLKHAFLYDNRLAHNGVVVSLKHHRGQRVGYVEATLSSGTRGTAVAAIMTPTPWGYPVPPPP